MTISYLIFSVVDENMCEANPDICPEGTRCVDEFRSYRCEISCPDGYNLNDQGKCVGKFAKEAKYLCMVSRVLGRLSLVCLISLFWDDS